jgi:hypothetical protein
MSWTTDELNRLATADELQIAGRRADGTLRRLVIIWAVVVDDVLYARSVRGPQGAWYRGVEQRHEGRIESGGVERDVVFADVPADDAVQDRIDAAYRAKYPGSPSAVDSIISGIARGTTLRIAPA